MRDQHQGHIMAVVQQLVLLPCTGFALRRLGQTGGQAFHMAQQTLHHLLKIAFAFAQIGIFHVIKLARDDFQLRGQGPFSVVQTLGYPMLDAIGQHFVLQEHQMHLQQRCEFGRRILGHGFLYALNFQHHSMAGLVDAL